VQVLTIKGLLEGTERLKIPQIAPDDVTFKRAERIEKQTGLDTHNTRNTRNTRSLRASPWLAKQSQRWNLLGIASLLPVGMSDFPSPGGESAHVE